METNIKTNSEEKTQILQSSNDIFNAFKKEFSTTVHKVKINSMKKEIGFRDITVNEQKTLSKTSLENDRRKDIIYDTQCQLINTLALEDGFSVYRLTEFDRIKILMAIYQSNYFRNSITYKCQKCGTENIYKLDFQKIMDKFDNFDLSDDVFSVEDDRKVFKFTINFPLVRTVSNFYKEYVKKYDGLSDSQIEILDSLGNIEYINLFIKQIEMIDKEDPSQRLVADLSLMTYSEIEKLLGMFPQSVIFSEDGGVINYITTNFIERLNKVFQYEKCANCGEETNEGIGSLIDFF